MLYAGFVRAHLETIFISVVCTYITLTATSLPTLSAALNGWCEDNWEERQKTFVGQHRDQLPPIDTYLLQPTTFSQPNL